MQRRIIIAGGRDYGRRCTPENTYDKAWEAACYDRLRRCVKGIITRKDIIVSGGAKGADALGEQFAERNGLGLERYPADWEKHGKGAGFRRNHQMALASDVLVAFWDGKSRGTKNMIEEAHKAKLETHVFYYEEE